MANGTKTHVIAIDAGTTGIRVNAYDKEIVRTNTAYREFAQHYPTPGWVEHDAAEIWRVTEELLKQVVSEVGAENIAGIGITNQRETTVIWDRKTGEPLYHAIVWQDRRTKEICERHREAGLEPVIRQRTGLLLDAYFSGTKAQWLIENAPAIGERARTAPETLAFKLSGGEAHVTDPTNASRTLLYDIDRRAFTDELCEIFSVPLAMLPSVVGSAEPYGQTFEGLLPERVRLCGLVGDQQGALFGQGCVEPGSSKNTYGTGCFALLNCGTQRPDEPQGIVTTIACNAAGDPVYALEGSVFVAGAAVQWLRDQLKVIANAPDSERHMATVPDTGGVFFVPAFTGLGAPYWDMEARGAILGLTRGTQISHIVRAALESICYQSRDLIEALETSSGQKLEELRIDGGASANNALAQFQADLLGVPCVRPADTETTSRGAAMLAGLGTGFWKHFEDVNARLTAGATRFEPKLSEEARNALYRDWKAAVQRVLTD
ncbi:MAG: glycerol kinase GlpK [Planctomycetota bacterium]|jgi:glycerol kinase